LLIVDQTVSLRAVEAIVLSSMLKALQTNCHRRNYELPKLATYCALETALISSNLCAQLLWRVADANQ